MKPTFYKIGMHIPVHVYRQTTNIIERKSFCSLSSRCYTSTLLNPIYFPGLKNKNCKTLMLTQNLCQLVKDYCLSVQTLCKLWTGKFEAKGISEPQMSAELIIAHVLGKKMIHEVSPNLLLKQHFVSRIEDLCHQRLKRIPVQYIIGEWDFQDLILKMREPVFIPRPETEELADLVCDYIKSEHLTCGKFLDIGCGSGAISLYILYKHTQMTGVAVDKHTYACDLTLENANALGLNGRLNIHQLDIFQKETLSVLKPYLPFDVIVSNPPYIPTQKIKELDPEVNRFECNDALDGGEDGLNVVKHILMLAPHLLSKGGQMWLEVDLGEPDKIKTIVEDNKSIKYVKTYKDFTQRDRFCVLKVV